MPKATATAPQITPANALPSPVSMPWLAMALLRACQPRTTAKTPIGSATNSEMPQQQANGVIVNAMIPRTIDNVALGASGRGITTIG